MGHCCPPAAEQSAGVEVHVGLPSGTSGVRQSLASAIHICMVLARYLAVADSYGFRSPAKFRNPRKFVWLPKPHKLARRFWKPRKFRQPHKFVWFPKQHKLARRFRKPRKFWKPHKLVSGTTQICMVFETTQIRTQISETTQTARHVSETTQIYMVFETIFASVWKPRNALRLVRAHCCKSMRFWQKKLTIP